MGAGEMKENGKIDPRRLDKAFLSSRNGQKVYHIHLCQHEKQACKSLINRVKSNEMQFYFT